MMEMIEAEQTVRETKDLMEVWEVRLGEVSRCVRCEGEVEGRRELTPSAMWCSLISILMRCGVVWRI